MRRTKLVSLMFLLCLLGGGTARATPGFPGVIASHLGLDFQPPCSVCHATESGGGPMAKPFGLALQQRGMRASDGVSLRGALDSLERDEVDSDGNGVPDVAQLRSGLDPNTGLQLGGPEIEYGCFNRVASQRRGTELGGLAFVVVVMAGFVLVRVRRARY